MSHAKEPWNNRTYFDRFWSRVNVSGANDCWEWARGTTSDGYGVFHFGNSSIRAHRFSYQQHNGKILEHECVLHSCDNPRCVNPKHLWIGTRAENNTDKESKKRGVHPVQSSGEANTNSVLTTPEVIAAKVMHRNGLPQARIAKLLGVSNAAICMIISGERRQAETERRVSACVNACAGYDTETIEAHGYDEQVHLKVQFRDERDEYHRATQVLQVERHKLTHERDELAAMLERFVESHGYVDYRSEDEKDADPDVIAARALLAKVQP